MRRALSSTGALGGHSSLQDDNRHWESWAGRDWAAGAYIETELSDSELVS
jgi:hypothetical protein